MKNICLIFAVCDQLMGVQDVERIPDRLMAASSEKNLTFTASQGRITGNGHSWRPSSVLFYYLVVLLPVEQIIFALQLPPPTKIFFLFLYLMSYSELLQSKFFCLVYS